MQSPQLTQKTYRFKGSFSDLSENSRKLPLSYPRDDVDISGKSSYFVTPSRMKLDVVTAGYVLLDFARESVGTLYDVSRFFITGAVGAVFTALRNSHRDTAPEIKKGNTSAAFKEMGVVAKSFGKAAGGAIRDISDVQKTLKNRLVMTEESQSAKSSLPVSLLRKPYQVIDEGFVRDMVDSGPQGKSVLAGAGSIEDQTILVWTEKDAGGGESLKLTCRLTPGANKRLMKWFSQREDVTEETGALPMPKKQILGSSLQETGETAFVPMGRRLTTELAPGVSLSYCPRIPGYKKTLDPSVTPYATQGKLVITVRDAEKSREEIQEALKHLAGTGVKVTLSTPEDLEYQYLMSMMKVLKADSKKSREALRKNLTAGNKVRFLQKHLSAFLGVEDVTRIEGYDWRPRFDTLCNPGKVIDTSRKAGRPHWNRFDAAPYIEGELKDHTLSHTVYAGPGVIGGIVGSIIRNSNSLASTEDRLTRLGIMTSGVSSLKDRTSGGANFVFTHIDPPLKDGVSSPGTFEFSRDILKRADQVAYRPGVFGHTQDQFYRKRTTLDTYHRVPIYEVMFKHSISFMDYLERINMPTEKDRAEVLEAFRDVGVREIRGKKIEDIVCLEAV